MIISPESLSKETIIEYLKTSEISGVKQEEAVALLLTSVVDLIVENGGPRLAKDVLTKISQSLESKIS